MEEFCILKHQLWFLGFSGGMAQKTKSREAGRCCFKTFFG